MKNKQAFFIVGSPGSGKDIIIRELRSNYNINEYTSSQINEMLTEDSCFKRAKPEKQNSLLYRESIIVNCKSYELDFVVTKHILESVGYNSHLIFVEADLETSFNRIKNRNLTESLEKISIGNSNKSTILQLFNSNIVVENSNTLDLSEFRKFILNNLNDFSFLDINFSLEEKKDFKLKLKKTVPSNVTDARGEQITGWTGHAESIDYPDYTLPPVATGPMQAIKTISGDPRSDKEKVRMQQVLNTAKKVIFKKTIPKHI